MYVDAAYCGGPTGGPPKSFMSIRLTCVHLHIQGSSRNGTVAMTKARSDCRQQFVQVETEDSRMRAALILIFLKMSLLVSAGLRSIIARLCFCTAHGVRKNV